MPIVAGNGTIEGGSSAFTIKNSADTTVFKRGISAYNGNNFGYYENAGVPAFVAGRVADPGWISYSAGGFQKINNYATNTSYNRGSHYNTSTTRFTAPVAGPYWFAYSCYIYSANYVHPVFGINGSATSGYHTQYRIRGHGMVVNYQQDAQIEEVLKLNAGDYVEVFWAPSGNSFQYVYYCLFQGAYVG